MTTDAGAVVVEGQLGRDAMGYWLRDGEGRLWRLDHFLNQIIGPARLTLERRPMGESGTVGGGAYALA